MAMWDYDKRTAVHLVIKLYFISFESWLNSLYEIQIQNYFLVNE